MNVYITIGGQGSRMKQISPVDKHLLYYKNKRIIEHLTDIFPSATIIGHKKTANRKETLEQIRHQTNCLIVDCDIIPVGISLKEPADDMIFVFESAKNKYGSVIVANNKLQQVSEKENISNIKCSGAYYVKSMASLLDAMTDVNSIASGMIGATTKKESTFIRLGDVEDYYEAL